MAKKHQRQQLVTAEEPLLVESSAEPTPSSQFTDQRPKTAPYTSSLVALRIGPEQREYHVPQDLLQYPEWSGSDSGWLCSDTIYLPDMDEDTGHVLVHYLYTGTYQTLDNKDASPVVERSIEFKRAVLAYFAAKSYELLGLQRLAVYKIEHFGIEMNIFDIIEAINEDFSKLPGNTSWFHDYLRRKAKAAFQEDHTVFARNAFLDRISNVDLNKVLVKYVVELYTNKISRMLNNGAESIPTLSGKSVPDAVDTPREEVPTDEPTTEEPAVEEPTAEEPVVATEEPAEELHAKDPEWVLRLFRNFTGSEPIKLPPDADVAPPAVNVDDVWGPSLKKGNKKKAREVSPVPLPPDPAADVTPLVVNVDDGWGLPLKKGKKKKAREVSPVPSPPDPPASVAPLAVNVDDGWEPSLKKGKKKMVREVSPVPPPPNPPADVAPLVVNVDDGWGLPLKKGKKKKARKVSPVLPPPDPPAECKSGHPNCPAPAVCGLDYPKCPSCKVEAIPKPDLSPAFLSVATPKYDSTPPALVHTEEADVPVTNDHSVPKAEAEYGIEAESAVCPTRAKHLLEGDMWKDCRQCRAVLHQVAIQLARAGPTDEDGYEMVDRVLME